MKAICLLSLLLSLAWVLSARQSPAEIRTGPQYTLSGYIRDAASGETLLYASIQDHDLGTGTTTNLYGFFSLTLPTGARKISFSYLGYETLTLDIDLQADRELKIELQSASAVLQEVIAEGKAPDEAVQEIRTSHRLPMIITRLNSTATANWKTMKENPFFISTIRYSETGSMVWQRLTSTSRKTIFALSCTV